IAESLQSRFKYIVTPTNKNVHAPACYACVVTQSISGERMSRNFKSTVITTMTSIASDKEWLEKSLENEYIRFYPYDGLIDKDCIGHGGFGVVFKAKVASSGITVAYKMIKYSDEGEFFKCFVN